MTQVNQSTFFTTEGNSYSGESSNDGIEVIKVEGNYEQETTKGYQLFDASKLPTKSAGGATVTNNGDGSFTISGSGNMTSLINASHVIADRDKILKLIKVGNIHCKIEKITFPRLVYQLYDSSNSVIMNLNMYGTISASNVITQSILDKVAGLKITILGEINNTIIPGTIKPMVWQDGDGTWEPFTGGMPSPNPDYPKEIKSVDISEFNSKKYQSLESQITTLTIPLKLRKLPNGICDTYENGIITRRIGEITFDGSSDEQWTLDSGVPSHPRYITEVISMKNGGNNRYEIISDKFYFRPEPYHDDGLYYAFNNKIIIYPPNNITTVPLLRTWLQSNNAKFWYETVASKTEQFNIPMLPSYYPYTNINHNSPISTSLMIWKVYEGFFIPKINWLKDDYINIEDFNRIRKNVLYLYNRSKKFYNDYDLTKKLVDEVNYSSYAYSDVWNFLEFTSNDIYNNTYKIKDVGSMREFVPYQNYIDSVELNRLESLCLKYYQLLKGQQTAIEKLSFTLGDYRGIKI